MLFRLFYTTFKLFNVLFFFLYVITHLSNCLFVDLLVLGCESLSLHLELFFLSLQLFLHNVLAFSPHHFLLLSDLPQLLLLLLLEHLHKFSFFLQSLFFHFSLSLSPFSLFFQQLLLNSRFVLLHSHLLVFYFIFHLNLPPQKHFFLFMPLDLKCYLLLFKRSRLLLSLDFLALLS